MSEREKVTVELSGAEALVLFDLLTRWSKGEKDMIAVEHQAEQRVLWDMQCALESLLVEPFNANYHDRLATARQEIAD